ncbi:PiggyBac transposable element-derived protein 4 [Anthophora plagiata]
MESDHDLLFSSEDEALEHSGSDSKIDAMSEEEINHLFPKFNKIWPIFEDVNRKFGDAITPEKFVTIDESLLLYKGRLGWVKYIPPKIARFGIKTYLLCESKSDYVYNFIIYTGKNTVLNREFEDLPMSPQVVMTLMRPLLNKGYCLTMDNFYNSLGLADLLIKNETDVYGTLRVSRKEVSSELKSKKLKIGETIAFPRGKVCVMKWKDKKNIYLISTIHSSPMVDVETRKGTIKKPQLVLDYNHTMGGVDRVDQHLSTYLVPRKRGKKYYKKIFFHLLDLAIWNAFMLYQKSDGEMDSLDFRLKVIELSIEKYKTTSISRSGRLSNVSTPLRLSARQFPSFVSPTANKENPTRQCFLCSRKKNENNKRVRKEIRYMCAECDIPLCAIPYFTIYHTVVNFD